MSQVNSEHVYTQPQASSHARGGITTYLSGATRYLAAAAYTDKGFRDKAIAIGEDEFRARAPELGIDADAVLQHCAAARRQMGWRNLALCIPLILLALTGIIGEIIQFPGDFVYVLESYTFPISIAWIAMAVIAFIAKIHTQHFTLTEKFGAGRRGVSPSAPSLVAASATSNNVVTYGAFSPFVGSGYDIGGWSFAINLEQTSPETREDTPADFSTSELYDALRDGFLRLGIASLSLSDRLYVDGRRLRDDRRFLPDILSRPVTEVGSDIIEEYVSKSGRNVRHYLCLEIADWNGEVVLSSFIRAKKNDTSLFIENSNFLLPPMKNEYYEIDKLSSSRLASNVVSWCITSIVSGPFLALAAPFSLWRFLMAKLNKRGIRRQRRREIRHDPLYNYGALQSIRELGTANAWHVYFQKLDREMHSKVVQQQLLDVVVRFLEEHGIDTSQIRDRGSHILNNGVIVSGGTISAESLAVGEGAQANVSKRRGRAAQATA